jgi:PAB-dependent poly(A)-specific ribonuclease subunit 2
VESEESVDSQISPSDVVLQIPAIIYFERVDQPDSLDFRGLPSSIDAAILSHDTSISMYDFFSEYPAFLPDVILRNRDPLMIKHECLSYEELPKPGTLVAIDAEFVSMQQVAF